MKIAGIYKIQNIINNKVYIGSSVDVINRVKNHKALLKKNKHHAYKLQRAINKYGLDNFTFEIIENVYFSGHQSTEYKMQILECIEQYYLNTFKASAPNNYNTSSIAGSILNTNISCSEKTKKSWITRRIKGQDKFSEKHKKSISKSLKNSDKFKEFVIRNTEQKYKKIFQYDLNGNFVREWKNMTEILQNNSTYSLGGVMKCIRQESRTYKQFVFSYLKKDFLFPRPIKQRIRNARK